LLTSLAVGLYWIALYLYVPTLPVYLEQRTEDLAFVGAILAQYGLWQLITRLPLGIAADWLGQRRPFIFAGFALAALGAWLMGSAQGATGLLVGRAVTGLAASAWVVMVVAFSSLFPPREAVRATAWLTIVNSVSRTLATLATGWLNDLGGYSLAFFLAAGAAGLAAVIFFPVIEDRYPSKAPNLATTGRLVTRRDVLLPSLLNAVLMYINYSTIYGFLPILAKEFGASNQVQSLLVSLSIAVGVAGNLATARLARHISGRTLAAAGFGLSIAGMALAWLGGTLTWIFAAQFFLGLGWGMAYPTLMGMSIQFVDGPQRSTAMGLHQAVYALGMFAGPWLSGILADSLGMQPMFALTAAGALALAGLGLLLCQPRV
jgi:MFS family permease